MRLSVIIPVHNAEEYLGECLDSVLGQSVHDLEVICVDDASTDASAAVIEDYCKKDSRVRLIKNEKNLYDIGYDWYGYVVRYSRCQRCGEYYSWPGMYAGDRFYWFFIFRHVWDAALSHG